MRHHSRARSGRRLRTLATVSGLAIVSTSLSLFAVSPAHAAPVEIRLLNINDFHGRIDADTTKFATTIEQERAEAGEANTLFLSAGDNIGASLFASASQDDQPTIDVLNALDLRASAVGNHEFDKGLDDLTGRVTDAADWDYLGANVYDKGTTTPALQEYATYEVGGITVGVVGAVTAETATLVSPAGISDVEFGDPVEAVNRVTAQLSDGDESNGEADVVVAEYHEGASAGTPDGATLEEEVAAGGTFAAIVEETSPEVDVIFTGHTHKQYAWQDGNRPIVQTGSYGGFVGEVDLTVDSETGEVTVDAVANVPRVAAEDLALPRVAEVKEIVDEALAEAAELGNQKVGEITADITTAYNGGSRDNRSAESTLGGLVANALRDGGRDIDADVDLGVTNPGGLRAELVYEGDTANGGPNNTDGVVTYAEANAVLPFNNTVAIGTMTGAQIKAVLEQQWRSGPYLQLALSENVTVTADATAPAGERITSIRIDGERVRPETEYTVSTLSFLAAGGDAFTAFEDGTWTDTGLLDAELWRNYFQENSPVSPDFARQQVFATGLPEAVGAGDSVEFVLGPDAQDPVRPFTGETLDLTSLGSPANTWVWVYLVQGDEQRAMGTFPVRSGTATVSFTAPADLVGDWEVAAVATPSGTAVGPTVEMPEPFAADLSVKAPTIAYGKAGRLRISVDAEQEATGEVQVARDGEVLGTAMLAKGVATVSLPAGALRPGTHSLTASYAGDGAVAPASSTFSVKVNKSAARIAVGVPDSMPVGKRPWVSVTVTDAMGKKVFGQVKVKRWGKVWTKPTRGGSVGFSLKSYASPGAKPVRVVFTGSGNTGWTKKDVWLHVR